MANTMNELGEGTDGKPEVEKVVELKEVGCVAI
jgi:hypothetical protein